MGGEPPLPLGAARHTFAPCGDCTLHTLPGLFLGSPKSLLRPLPVPPTRAPELRQRGEGVARLPLWVELEAGAVPGSTPNFLGIQRGTLCAQDGALVYENFLFLKRATMPVGPSRRHG